LITVEDLVQKRQRNTIELHTVQQAMVDQHGSQCGFCTPGFVMSLFAMFHDNDESDTTRENIDLGLAGNLCRCTGYAPIVRAAEQSLKANRGDHFDTNKARTIEQLESIQSDDALEIGSANGHFLAPRSLAELCDLLDTNPGATLLAGATDVGLWVTKHLRQLSTIIYLGEIAELKQLADDGRSLSIGAAVSYTDATAAIAALYPEFEPLIQRIGGMQVRNAGTIGGNIANGSPIGDMPPGLIAAGAKLVLHGTSGRRRIDLEDFFIDYGKQDLRPGEFVEQIILPRPAGHQLFATYKVSKRFEQDISAVCGAFAIEVEGSVISKARVCFGGMAATPKRATACEQALVGNPWEPESIDQAMQAMKADFTPLTDMRASAKYRMRVAMNLLQRFFLDNCANSYPCKLESAYGRDRPMGETPDG